MTRPARKVSRHRAANTDTPRPILRCVGCKADAYLTRKAAKGAADRRYPGEHKGVYRCPTADYWHFETMPPHVVQGRTRWERRDG